MKYQKDDIVAENLFSFEDAMIYSLQEDIGDGYWLVWWCFDLIKLHEDDFRPLTETELTEL